MMLGLMLFALGAAQTTPLLTRNYREGETLVYQMQGVNEQWRYEAKATGVVKRDAAGAFVEEYTWSNDSGASFRQVLSLDPAKPPSLPNLGQAPPVLIGPITDMLTFYADLWLATKTGALHRAGAHIYQKNGIPASWADGTRVVLGETCIDFDITLAAVDEATKTATLVVRHVPPEQPQVRLPAAWMREHVADAPNNWVLVENKDGRYTASVGKETFDVRIQVSTEDGRILSAVMDNRVETSQRECRDAALSDCGPAHPHPIVRRIEVHLQ